jgi:hypothetical protein
MHRAKYYLRDARMGRQSKDELFKRTRVCVIRMAAKSGVKIGTF